MKDNQKPARLESWMTQEEKEQIILIAKANGRSPRKQTEFILREAINNPFTIQCANENELQQLTNHLAILRSEVKN
mgnify:CR=1 FL=1